MAEIKILYMNSFSRSGETLMQRTLNAHPEICVLHQLLNQSEEKQEQYNVFKRIRQHQPSSIKLSKAEAEAIGIGDKPILLVKNAVFEITKAHYGFTLVRNPYSCFASYRKLARKLKEPKSQMRRWAEYIDKQLLSIVDDGDFLGGFISLYARKFTSLLPLAQPYITYESFVQHPKSELRALLNSLDLSWSEAVMSAHTRYQDHQMGHGGLKLSSAIHPNDSNVMPELKEKEVRRIYSHTSGIMSHYGYEIDIEKHRIAVRPRSS